MLLENRSAIITGAGRGIGRAIALAYSKEGARHGPSCQDRRRNRGTPPVKIRSLGASALVIPTDVSDQDQVDRMVSPGHRTSIHPSTFS